MATLSQLRPADLKPGDVLLYHGDGFISRMIRLFDGSEYSHASIFDGSEVVEAIASGIERRPLSLSVSGADYVHVYRFISAGKEQLGSPNFPVAPVLARIKHYTDNRERYAYEQILLLAILASTRRVRIPVASWIVRNILDEASRLASVLIGMGKEPVICSELVYRCFAEAQGDTYKLTIRGSDTVEAAAAMTVSGVGGSGAFTAAAGGDPVEAMALEEEAAAFLQLFTAAKNQPLDNEHGPSFGVQAVADFVTPGDLKKSPNLALLGVLTVDLNV